MSNFDPQKVDQLLREGIDAAKSGKKEIARSKFREVVAIEQNNEKAWFWLASVAETDDEKIFCLGNVTVINPDNERAKQMLEALLSKTASSQQPKSKGISGTSGDGDQAGEAAAGSRRLRLIALIVGIPVVLLLLVIVVFPRLGGSPPAPTEAPTANTSGATQAETQPTVVGTAVAVASSPPTSAPTVLRPTLPPSWTPVPSITSAVGIFATPLASPPPGLTGRLVAKSGIQRTTDENLAMFILNPDGSNLKPVQVATGDKEPDRGDFGILTPDGKRIIFARYLQGTEAIQMVIMNTNGTQSRELSFLWNNLPPLADHQMLTMSRDAKLLVFVALNIPDNDGDPGVYYVPLTFNSAGGLGPPPPTETATSTITPKPRPTVPSTAPATEAPTVVPTATEGPTATFVPAKVSRVTAKGTGKNTWPTISPDDKTVVFAADTSSVGGDGTDLYSIPLLGGTPANLTNDGTDFKEAAPEYSPDGKTIAFEAMKNGENFNSIFVMDANGQNRKVLIQGDKKNDNIRPYWSPDGKYIAFSSNRTGKWEIFIVEVASGNLYQVTSTAGSAYTVCTSWNKS